MDGEGDIELEVFVSWKIYLFCKKIKKNINENRIGSSAKYILSSSDSSISMICKIKSMLNFISIRCVKK